MTLETPVLRRRRERFIRPAEALAYVRGRAVPTWVLLLVGYAASRAVSIGILAAGYAFGLGAGATISHSDGGSGFLNYLQSWDGLHYRQIAEHGYPSRLPIDAAGDVTRNPWAFLPLYPYLTRALMLVGGLDFTVAAIIISLVFGGAATFALHQLLLPRFGATGALWSALFFCFGPMSYLFQVAYADSMFTFFMLCSVIAMVSRRWLVMIPFAVAASFTHPGAIALAAAIGIGCLARLLRHDPTFGVGEKIAAGLAFTVITIAGVGWPIIAGVVTGDPSGYFDTETAWWANYIGHANFIPFSPWFIFAWHYAGGFGIALVVIVLVSFAYWLTSRTMRRFGDDVLAYTGSYAAYLVAVFLPQQSIVRMLLPLSPLLGHPDLWESPFRRRMTLGVSVLLQFVTVLLFWVVWPP